MSQRIYMRVKVMQLPLSIFLPLALVLVSCGKSGEGRPLPEAKTSVAPGGEKILAAYSKLPPPESAVNFQKMVEEAKQKPSMASLIILHEAPARVTPLKGVYSELGMAVELSAICGIQQPAWLRPHSSWCIVNRKVSHTELYFNFDSSHMEELRGMVLEGIRKLHPDYHFRPQNFFHSDKGRDHWIVKFKQVENGDTDFRFYIVLDPEGVLLVNYSRGPKGWED
jgi:hypothetical protein